MSEETHRRRWLALYVLCLADLMIVLDSTIVNVALPSIRTDLGFSEASLAWVVNAYLLTFGGFLLLAGRFGDLYGQRRLFLVGIAEFTLASLACGLANSETFLVVARAVQGLGGAIVSAIALSLIMILFTEPAERAKAMGIIGFVLSGGGTAGVLLGGTLTDLLSWHWIFLVNIPVGIAAFMFCRVLLPPDGELKRGSLDLGGAITITASLMIAVYAIVNGHQEGWTSAQTLGGLGLYVVALLLFARAPVDGSYFADVLPGMLIIGLGGGITFNPILLAAMSGVAPTEAGLASGVVNTSFMMGGALGLAILASLAASRTASLSSSGHGALAALNGGYHVAFVVGAGFAVFAAAVAAVLIRAEAPANVPEPVPAPD